MRPGPLRQVVLVLALGVRRWLNRMLSGVAARRSAKGAGTPTARPPTARRKAGVGAILVLAGLALLAQVIFSMAGFAMRAGAAADGRPAFSDFTWTAVAEDARSGRNGWQADARRHLAADPLARRLSDDERAAQVEAAIDRLGRAPAADAEADRRRGTSVLAAALFAGIALCIAALSLGMGNIDLARPDWDELWLASLPLSGRAIFAARLVQYSLLNVLAWLLVGPGIATLAIVGGMSWTAGISLGVATAAAWAVATAALRLAAETWLRQRLAHARIKNLQALLTVVGMAAMVALYAVAMGFGPLPGWFLAFAAVLPWELLPTGWAAIAAVEPARAPWLVIAGLALAAVAAAAAVRLCARWSAGGLIVHDGTLSAARGGAVRAWRSMRVLGKDLILLRRDRALLVQVLVMPLFMIALQLALNPELAQNALSGFHAAATFVVALGGWVLLSAGQALAHEGQALWILAGAPTPLAHALRGKVAMWASFAVLYAVLGLAAVIVLLPWPGPAALADIAMILTGLPLLAVLAVGLGAAATDPQSTVPNRRVGVGALYLYMLVMGLFSLTVNLGTAHQRLAMLALLAVIGWALWQRLRDRLAWLFEPVERPPRRIDLADGAWAAFAFLVLQGLIAALLIGFDCEAGLAMLLAFALAGMLTATATVLLLWRARVPGLARALGLLPAAGGSLLRTGAIGLAAGAAAALAAAAYLAGLAALAPHLPGLADALTQAEGPGFDGWQLVVLVVVCAPLCEEFIFRGLLFRGLRRDLGPWWAAAASAGVFAIIHPSLGVVPVFGLGLACAIAYERTGWLLAPVLAHALYNGAVLLLSGR